MSASRFSMGEMLEDERWRLIPGPPPFDGQVKRPARVACSAS
jgi:hypothetical protein